MLKMASGMEVSVFAVTLLAALAAARYILNLAPQKELAWRAISARTGRVQLSAHQLTCDHPAFCR